ncbi:hypothetical protein F8M41_006250 [Gigaspora margarita]|uniref:Uncharacterized protein n=1 Tax=Gigaspora margarita TaxID=4874 RepID=A0A8H4ERD3_GIGMA|nr:hypothetical protein F8M41_006250 [Gigaspora margarita]
MQQNDGDESDYVNAHATFPLRSHENDDIVTSSASSQNHRSNNDILTLLVSSPARETDNITTSLQISPTAYHKRILDLAINIRNGIMIRVENEEPNKPSTSALIHEPARLPEINQVIKILILNNSVTTNNDQ